MVILFILHSLVRVSLPSSIRHCVNHFFILAIEPRVHPPLPPPSSGRLPFSDSEDYQNGNDYYSIFFIEFFCLQYLLLIFVFLFISTYHQITLITMIFYLTLVWIQSCLMALKRVLIVYQVFHFSSFYFL
jgi:hypothetical protein